MSNPLHIAFDLGSFSIKGAVGRVNQNEELEILSIQAIQSESVECGTIVDKEKLREDLEYLIDRIEREAKINIKDVMVSVSGQTIKSINSSTRSRTQDSTNFKINEEVRSKLLSQCADIQVSTGRHVLHNISQGFIIDDSPLIRNPLGMRGKIIQARSHIIHVQEFNLTQIDTCLNGDLGIEINPVFDGLASASINLSQDDQKLGVVFVDIGSDKTNVLIYKDNYLIHSNVIPIGSNSVTKDLATRFNTSIQNAEEIKKKHVSALSKLADVESNFELSIENDDLKKQLNEKEVSEIAEIRFEEIINKVNEEIQASGVNILKFGSGVKITGGGSNIKNLDLLFKEQLGTKCEYLPLKNIVFKENLEDKREYATLIGLLLWPVFNVEDDNPLIGIKKSFTENFSNIWKGFFE
jgi:cell division protein FtsA